MGWSVSRRDSQHFKFWLEVPIQYNGLNPYKAVEMFWKYRQVVLDVFHLDDFYAEPSAEVYAKVKKEKVDQSEFWKKLKATKYADDKDQIEILALDEDNNNEGSKV